MPKVYFEESDDLVDIRKDNVFRIAGYFARKAAKAQRYE